MLICKMFCHRHPLSKTETMSFIDVFEMSMYFITDIVSNEKISKQKSFGRRTRDEMPKGESKPLVVGAKREKEVGSSLQHVYCSLPTWSCPHGALLSGRKMGKSPKKDQVTPLGPDWGRQAWNGQRGEEVQRKAVQQTPQ